MLAPSHLLDHTLPPLREAVPNHNISYEECCQALPMSPVVMTLRPRRRGTGSIPGWGSKIPHAMQCVLTGFRGVRLLAILWTAARQAPLSMGFSSQECWSGLLCPLRGDLPNPGIKPRSPALQEDSLPAKPQGKPSV